MSAAADADAPLSSGKRVLIVCTSHEALGDTGEKTGLWMEELAHPYYIFQAHGVDVTIASVKGGEIPVDEASLAPPYNTPQVERFLLDGALWSVGSGRRWRGWQRGWRRSGGCAGVAFLIGG